MKPLVILALLVLPLPATAALPQPYSAEQAEQLRCVAALAIAANEQVRGTGNWADLPRLNLRGAHFAGVIGEQLTSGGARTREDVRANLVAAVASFQKAGILPRDTLTGCIAMMERLDPPPTTPTCAAIMALAYQEMKTRDGLTPAAQTLATFAALLNSRARDELISSGKSDAESDIVLGLAKEKVAAEAKSGPGAFGDAAIQYCADLAKPVR